MKYEIRKATVEDIPLLALMCVELIKTNHLPFKNGGPVCVENNIKDFFRADNGVFYIAIGRDAGVFDGKVIGWVGATYGPYPFSDEPLIQVRAWDVVPQYRAQGLGGVLFAKVVEWAKFLNVGIITVGVNIDSSDTPELAFNKLEKLGFKEFERTFYIKL